MINRQQILTYVAIVGGIFLLFYWTHMGFNSSIKSRKSNIAALEKKIEKATALAANIKRSGGRNVGMTTGLLSFLQTSAEKTGLASRIGSIKPKSVPGAAEGATIRLERLNYSELISFLRSVERYGNLTSSNIKITKRFDNGELLNLVMDIVKK